MNEVTIIEEYKKLHSLYQKLETQCLSLIKELFKDQKIKIHTIASRLKTKESLKGKILNKSEKYQKLTDITDLVGIRIIALFEDDVQKIENIIKDEFLIDPENSEDKFIKLNPNEFGYRSVHYICSVNDARASLPEYKSISKLKFEVQIRSLLQHAWAEIEHDLGYKNEGDLPSKLQRDFFRIAGLLELADMEFVRIRKEIKVYSDKLRINDNSATLPVNVISMDKYLDESDILNQIESEISKLNNIQIQGKFRGTQLVKILSLLGINDLNELEATLIERRDLLLRFTKKWIEGQNLMRRGLSIWTLAYIIKAEEGKTELENYLEAMNIGETQYIGTTTDRINKTLSESKTST